MRAAIYETFGGPITLQQVPDPVPPPDGVVVRVQANGICRSDWHGWHGHDPDITLPHVPGHELAGVVEAVGPGVTRWQPGDRVTVPFAMGCGTCPQCMSGNHQICDDYFQPGFTAWGSFAEFVALPHADVNLVRLPESIGFVEAASLGCRFITAYRAVVVKGAVRGGEWVAVHGCGGVGLSAIMIASALGANVIGIDINPATLVLAQAVGAAYVLNARETDNIPATIHEITSGGAHASLDALGIRETCRNSILSLRKRGRHVQVGLLVAQDGDPPLPMARVIGWELTILGSHGMQAHQYPAMLAMIAAGKLAPARLVSQTISLEAGIDSLMQMDDLNQPGVTVIDQF